MKNIIGLLIGLLLLPLAALAQSSDYDPVNPPNPDYPEEALPKYKVILEAIPGGAYNFTTYEYVEGKKVTVSASNTHECYFQGWYDVNGNLVTQSNSYTFTMPAADVRLYARFSYDPANPADPVHINRYWLRLKAEPEVACSFNFKDQKVDEGTTQSLYAYPNNGFRFVKWVDEDGITVGTTASFKYLMPSRNTTLTAVFDYAPEVPANPGTNLWDAAAGDLSMDFFTPGNLTSAMTSMVGGSAHRDEVTHLMVDGAITSGDFGFANYFTHITYLDMSRADGVNNIPSYTWQNNTNLQEIELPAAITSIGQMAFQGCTMLRAINLYSPVPPVLGKQALDGVPADIIIYVPADAVDTYKAAEGWSQYTIMPLRTMLCAVQVSLPDVCADGRYRDMVLELVNTHSGQRYRYIVTDRLAYTFTRLVRHTNWKAYLKNTTGDVIGETPEVEITQEQHDLTFASLKTLQTLQLDITTDKGQTITGASALWYNPNGGKLPVEGLQLPQRVPGYSVSYVVTLNDYLAKQFEQPQQTVYTVVETPEGVNHIPVVLKSYPVYTITGRILDKVTGLPVSGATITATETINGLSASFVATTDALGRYAIQVRAASELRFQLTEENHITDFFTLTPDFIASGATADGVYTYADVRLRPISGVVASLQFTYAQSVPEGQATTVQAGFSDYQNVSYTLYNITKGQSVTNFSVQYPKVIIAAGVEPGDVVMATAHSTASTPLFNDTQAQATVDADGQLSLVFHLVQRGGLYARFLVTDNRQVVGALYDAAGQLVSHHTYNTNFEDILTSFGDDLQHNATPNFILLDNIPDGTYTLVTMGQSTFLGTPNSLDAYASLQLQAGVDYISNEVTISSGHIIALRNVIVPLLQESKFYYTGTNTSFAVNKANTIAGNYLTLSGKVDFADDYKTRVSDVRIFVQLPPNCQMVEGSAMLGKSLTTYENADGAVTIPLGDNYTDRVKFSIVPSYHGNYTVSAYVKFLLDGVETVQPIGNTSYTVTDLSLWAPSMVSTPQLFVEGNAPGFANVEVFDASDNNTLLGQTSSFADGYWSIETVLNKPRNLSMHEIYARITTRDGAVMTTSVRPVEYNERVIRGRTVEMKYWNGMPWVNRTIDLTWDLEHSRTSARSYMFVPSTEFSFIANLTNNDPAVVDSCIIRVFTNNHEWIELPARYIPGMNRWAAHSTFTTQSMPIGVRVNVISNVSESVSATELEKVSEEFDEAKHTVDEIQSYEPDPITANPDNYNYFDNQQAFDNWLFNLDSQLNDVQYIVVENQPGSTFEADEKVAYDVEEVPLGQLDRTTLDLLAELDAESEGNWDADGLEADDPLTGETEKDGDSKPGTLPGGPVEADHVSFYVDEKTDALLIADEVCDKAIRIAPSADAAVKAAARGLADKSSARRSRIATALVESLRKEITTAQTALHVANQKYATLQTKAQNNLTLLASAIESTQLTYDYATGQLETETDPATRQHYIKVANKAAEDMGELQKQQFEANAAMGVINDNFSVLRDLSTLISYANWAIQDVNNWQAFIDRILPCNGLDDPQARGMKDICEELKTRIGERYWQAVDMTKLTAYLLGSVAVDSDETVVLNNAATAMANYLATQANGLYYSTKMMSRNCLRKAKRDRNRYVNCDYAEFEVIEDAWDFSLPYPVVEPIIDPSGYVYEGVSSNRLEGVTATAYYKHTYEDEYGDPHEDIVLWDAEQYSQQNPLTTDANGQYQWDVPQGLWQVKFEKEGYQTTYSEWLPVPPPQLDVNIAMVQLAQPSVVRARAFETDGKGVSTVEVEFSKYMKPELMTSDNVYLKGVRSGVETLLTGLSFACPDLETDVDGGTKAYARKLQITTPGVDLGNYDEVYLLVSSNLESYAGVCMEESFQQRLDVERRVDSLVVDSNVVISCGGTTMLTVHALPAKAAAGRQLAVTTAASVIATLGADGEEKLTLTFDADGRAELRLDGVLYGTTALRYQLEGEDLSAITTVHVVDSTMLAAIKAPVASRLSGTALYRGQTVALTCETEGATIYYTTDGTCPCESATRQLYSAPIPVLEDMTIRAMAVGYTGEESEIVTLSYTLRQTDMAIALQEGWNWLSHNQASPIALASLQAYGNVVTVDGAQEIAATQSVKIKSATASTIALSGEEYNPQGTPASLSAGWNALGYPVNDYLTLADALAYVRADEGDAMLSLEDGFALYHDGLWTGTLRVLRPGQGYYYRASTSQEFIYGTTSTTNARALYNQTSGASALPVHQYPSVMGIVAEISDNGVRLDSATAVLRAYCGDELRGTSAFVDGLALVSIHGDEGDVIRFELCVPREADLEPLTDTVEQTLTLSDDVVGTFAEPYRFDFATAIQGLQAERHATGVYTLSGQKISNERAPRTKLPRGVYILGDGRKVVR